MEDKTNAIIVGVITSQSDNAEDILEELERLVEALELEVCGQVYQELPNPNPATYIGSGKLAELATYVEEMDAGFVIFADTLSPAQLRNITKVIKVNVLDRTGLILEIFRQRARTREAKLQVEVANLQYMLPRLVGMWTFFGRQGGASGSQSNRGAGEKQLELDRRTIEKRLSELKRNLEQIEHDRTVQRSARNRSTIPRVALVGYTNAGKSTLMNALLDMSEVKDEKKVFEKDMLFATLDTSIRRISTGDKKDFLLSDTVGFVSNLPHGLIKAFRSTLDEVKFADLLLIVVDTFDENNIAQIDITIDTLKELEADKIPRIIVMNKADKVASFPEGYDEYNDRIFISAKTGLGMETLLEKIKSKVYGNNEIVDIIIPYSDGKRLALLNENARIITREYTEDGIRIVADCPDWLVGKVR